MILIPKLKNSCTYFDYPHQNSSNSDSAIKMNSLYDANDLMNPSNRQDFLRLPQQLSSSFTFGNCETTPDHFTHSFNYSNQHPSHSYSNSNENFVGIFNSNDPSSRYSIKSSNFGNCSNLSESSLYSYGGNNLNPFLNKASVFSNEHTSSENLFRLNFLQFDSNLKHYSNLIPPSNTQLDCRAFNFAQHGQPCSQLNSNSQLYQTNMSHNEKPRKQKKSRILFSQWQINELEKLFKKQKYVTSNERELMAKRLKLQANQVKIWFQNRRYKIKKQNESHKE